jgi:mannose-1-phosphate guanylyltransferase/mannose-6-phosphate isomerase
MRMSDGETLAEKTLRRAHSLARGNEVLTVTGRDYYFIMRDEYLRHEDLDASRNRFLLEPVGRNTAPAIALAAWMVRERHGGEACMLILPADHLIQDQAAFTNAVDSALHLATDQHLVTFGIHPTHPETGYGYIKTGQALGENGFRVERFVEKPELDVARKYLASGQFLWNSGMFCFTADRYLDALNKHEPEIAELAEACWMGSERSADPLELASEFFGRMPAISVDYAVMERAEDVAVVPGNFGWSDVGSWKAMSDLADADDSGNQVQGRAIMVDTTDTFVQGENRLIATVGVNNLVVVDTGDAVLVADRDRAQDVKAVVDQLHQADDQAAIFHQTVYRPWGSYTILEDADDCKVKRLVVKPGQVLSLQLHHRRSEHWTVVQGVARVRVGDDEFDLQQNQSAYIPTETLHRLENPTDSDIHLIEVQCGDYFGEDDIERLEDVYGRV